jgi:hypothetical protein
VEHGWCAAVSWALHGQDGMGAVHDNTVSVYVWMKGGVGLWMVELAQQQ